MPHPKAATSSETPPGWRVFRSTAGRWWATRERPFAEAENQAGAWRTVDGDDEIELRQAIAEQESRAALGASS